MPGSRPPPGAGGKRPPSRIVQDPEQVRRLLAKDAARTSSRDELSRRNPSLKQVSPAAGQIDEDALAELAARDADAALGLLADLARSTDRELRIEARRLAAKLAVRLARRGAPRARGGGRLATVADDGSGGDLDLDATLDRLDHTPRLTSEDLRVRAFRRARRSWALLVDVSGSVAGHRLATAIVTASALAQRLEPGDDLTVIGFWSKAVVLRRIGATAPPAEVIDDLLTLRGGGTTDLDQALRAAAIQLASTPARERCVIILTDGVVTEGPDPASAAAAVGGPVHVLALSREPESVAAVLRLAAAGRGRVAWLDSPSRAPAALLGLLS